MSTDVAIKTEMHETMGGRMTSMKPLKSVAVPANHRVVFAPGGRHVMRFEVKPGIKQGSNVVLPLSFADGKRLRTNADVINAGDPPPA